jgi:3-isopropylmalate dehydrogenase
MHKKIAILPGDGIGLEVMQQTLRVLDHIAKIYNHHFEYLEAKIGGVAYESCGTHCPQETLDICDQADALLFGSVGGPLEQQHLAKWKNCEANSILKLRKHFNFNINIRPIKVYPELVPHCPLKSEVIKKGIDMLIFRELVGGIYFGRHEFSIQNSHRQAIDECVYDETQIRSIAHEAFKAAQLRRKKVCSVDKANVLATSKLWRDIVTEVAKKYPDVTLTHMLVDNCAMQMMINPKQFDVILTENMFGDILSDLAAALPGSLGLIPSASLNPQGKGLYEPSGGSAPDIAGKGIANPSAQILSAAMMLHYSFALLKEAQLIEEAVKATINSGMTTIDLAQEKSRSCSTIEFVDAVNSYIQHKATINHKATASE